MSVNLESVLHTLDAMERKFRGGYGWGKWMLHNRINGKMCLMGAVSSVRATDGNRSWVPSEEIAAATWCIREAVRERGYQHVESFNDAQLFYGQIAAVMTRARQLASMWYARALPAPQHVPQILPPVSVPQIAAPPAARPAIPCRISRRSGLRSSPSPIWNGWRSSGNDDVAQATPGPRPRSRLRR